MSYGGSKEKYVSFISTPLKKRSVIVTLEFQEIALATLYFLVYLFVKDYDKLCVRLVWCSGRN
jgi:hypothetical protein